MASQTSVPILIEKNELLKDSLYPRSLTKINRSFWIDIDVLGFLQRRAMEKGSTLSREVRTILKKYVEAVKEKNGKEKTHNH